MNNDIQRTYRVSKIDAARRQLETAIRLFFYDIDFVSVHTLLCASHEIFVRIGESSGVHSIIRHRFKETFRGARIDNLSLHSKITA